MSFGITLFVALLVTVLDVVAFARVPFEAKQTIIKSHNCRVFIPLSGLYMFAVWKWGRK